MLFVSVVASAALFLVCSADDAVVESELDVADTTAEADESGSDRNGGTVALPTEESEDVFKDDGSSTLKSTPTSDTNEVTFTEEDQAQTGDDGDGTQELTTEKVPQSPTEENYFTATDDKAFEEETTTFSSTGYDDKGKAATKTKNSDGEKTTILNSNYDEQDETVAQTVKLAEERTTILNTKYAEPEKTTVKFAEETTFSHTSYDEPQGTVTEMTPFQTEATTELRVGDDKTDGLGGELPTTTKPDCSCATENPQLKANTEDTKNSVTTRPIWSEYPRKLWEKWGPGSWVPPVYPFGGNPSNSDKANDWRRLMPPFPQINTNFNFSFSSGSFFPNQRGMYPYQAPPHGNPPAIPNGQGQGHPIPQYTYGGPPAIQSGNGWRYHNQ